MDSTRYQIFIPASECGCLCERIKVKDGKIQFLGLTYCSQDQNIYIKLGESLIDDQHVWAAEEICDDCYDEYEEEEEDW